MEETQSSPSDKALELAIAHLDKQYGKGSVLRLGSDSSISWPSVSTGAYSLDRILGIGGLPLGRVVEIYGGESSGKSTLCLSLVAEAQMRGMKCLYIDAEHAIDPTYAQNLGVNMDDLLFAQPGSGEEALDIVDTIIGTGSVNVIVIDSVAALTPQAELDGDMDKDHMGLQPRMMAKGLRKITAKASENKVLVVFINQIREKIGVFFGSPEVTPGGRSLKFYASVRIDLRKKEDLKDNNGVIFGVKTKAKLVKNKMGPPLRLAEFDIVYGKGIDNVGCIVDVAFEVGIFTKSGAWYVYEGNNIANGRPKTIEALASDLDLLEEIKKKIEE